MTIHGTIGTTFVTCARTLPLVIVAACGASDENLTDTAVYPFIGAFLDRDADGACSPLDLTGGIHGIIGGPDLPSVIALGPSSFSLDDPRDVCNHFVIEP